MIAAFAGWVVIGICSLIIAAGLCLHLPQVQNTLFNKLIQHLNYKTQFHIQHKQFSFTWFHQVKLTELEIKDPNNQPVCTIEQLKIYINPLTLLFKKGLNINYLEVKNGILEVIQTKREQGFNIQMLLDRLADSTSASKVDLYPQGIKIQKALLQNFSFFLDDQTRPPITGLDFYHIHVEDITTELSKFHYEQDKWVGNLHKFTGYYPIQDLNIKQVAGQFEFTPTVLALRNLYIATAYSHLQGDFMLTHEGLATLLQQPHQAHLTAQVEALEVDTQELAFFLPYLQGHDTTYTLKGNIIGKLNNLAIKDLQVTFGQHPSYLRGAAKIQGLPHVNAVSFSLDLVQGCLYAEDLFIHLPQYHPILQKLKVCNIQGTLAGTIDQLVTKAQFSTDIGQIATNLTIQIDQVNELINYEGEINTTNFDVGKLLNLPELGEITLHTQLHGQGVEPAKANFYVKALIEKLKFHQYEYQNIRLDGRFSKSFFKGHASIEDPHVVAYLATQVNFHANKKAVIVEGLLSSLAADKLGLTKQPLQASSEVNIDLEGHTWDELMGYAKLQRTHLLFNNKPLTIKELYIATYKKENGQSFVLHSDLLDIQAEGAPTYRALAQDLHAFIAVYQQSLLKISASSIPAYTKEPYTFNYHIKLKDINPLLHIIAPNTYVGPHASITGSFRQAQEEVKLEFHVREIDSLQFANQKLEGSQWTMSAQHQKAANFISATSQLKVHKHIWEDFLNTENLLININWMNEEILFTSTLGSTTTHLQYSLAGKAHLRQGGIDINFHDTAIRLADKRWGLDPKGRIYIRPGKVECHHLILSWQDEQLAVEGKWSSLAPENLVIRASNLLINNFSFLIDKQLDGIIHGTVSMTNTSDQPQIEGDVQVKGIKVDELGIGDLYAQATWDNRAQHMQVACQLKKADKQMLHIAGSYMPTHPTQTLDLIADFSHAQLAIFEPFVTPVCSKLQGELQGHFSIQGSLQNPLLYGKGTLGNLVLQFKHLKAIYKGHGAIEYAGNKMKVKNLHLSDSQEGYANFYGKVTHQSLKDMTLDLTGQMHQLEILDTKYEDNEYFYGKGIVSGNIRLSGPVQHIDIHATAKTEKGTSLVIPIGKHNKKAGQEEFIRFVNFKAKPTKDLLADLPSMQLEGINLHINLEITPDAWAKIMFNGKEGDIIEGTGKGSLTIQSDTKGSLHMSGNYELVEGNYNFSVYKVVRKKFKILPGSNITWIDNPYDGILHVKATYEQRTYLSPLLDNLQGTGKTGKDKKKYPIQVGLLLEGLLSAPTIQFDVQFLQLTEDPDLQEAITTFQEKIATDQDYLKNQVFSLVMFKTFAAGTKVRLSNNTLQRSMGELFSQQLSSLAERIDENLEIDTDIDLADITDTNRDVAETKQERNTSLPIKISYNLWDGRLIVSRKSKINFAAGKEIDFRNIVGDWSIGYGLTDDNKLRIKLQLYPSGEAANINMNKSILGAISLVYAKSFNKWSELFWDKKFKK